MKKYHTLKNKKDYEKFISQIPHYLKELSNCVKKVALSFNEEEVRMISKHFINIEKNGIFNNEEKRILITYVGELFKINFGGEWAFTGTKSDSYAINEPIITRFKDEGMRMSPSEWIYKMFEKDDSNHFNYSIKYMKEFQKKIDDVFAEVFPKKKKKAIFKET